MPLDDVAQAFLALRPRALEHIGEDGRADAVALFDRLAAATTERAQQAAIDELIVALTAFAELRADVRRALRAGSVSRGQTRSAQRSTDRGSKPPAATGATFERWPHVQPDRPEPLAADSDLGVSVWVDATPPDDAEVSRPLELPDLPELTLRVTLVTSHHFQIEGAQVGSITVTRDRERSTAADFKLRVAKDLEGTGVISAFFTLDARPVGSVHRQVTIVTADAAPVEDLPEPIVSAALAPAAVDLVVQIAAVPGAGDRRFTCTVSTPHLREYADAPPLDWELPDGNTTKTLVAGRLAGFTRAGVTNDARRAALKGAGLQLFEAAPANFREVYWALRDQDLPLASLLVVSSEPHIPWELMIPTRDGVDDELPIGVTSAVGRWVDPKHVSPLQPLELRDSYVIAPSYIDRKLRFSAGEARYVCDTFSGREISPALYATIEAMFGQGGTSLLHFICHGKSDPETGEQVIQLDPDEVLGEVMLRGMDKLKAGIRESKPMVFINACEVGAQSPALVGTGGFAAGFVALGARAVVAPIWSVKDAVAAKAAREFYAAVEADPTRPFAAILADIRRKAYVGSGPEDSWAAYCFYGDPLAASKPR